MFFVVVVVVVVFVFVVFCFFVLWGVGGLSCLKSLGCAAVQRRSH